jgi:hypothetical protein
VPLSAAIAARPSRRKMYEAFVLCSDVSFVYVELWADTRWTGATIQHLIIYLFALVERVLLNTAEAGLGF